jgi:hypothetical protein
MPRTFENGALPPRPDGTGGILGYPVASAMRQERSFADECRIADFDPLGKIADFDPLGKFGAEFSMTGVDIQSGNCAQDSALRNGANCAKRYIKATLSSKVSSWLVLNWTQWPVFIIG